VVVDVVVKRAAPDIESWSSAVATLETGASNTLYAINRNLKAVYLPTCTSDILDMSFLAADWLSAAKLR
jgi:hypothetical protein